MPRIDHELRDRLRRAPIDARGVRELLDGLSSAERIAAIRSLGRAAQRNLFEGVAGFLPLRLADLVSASLADLVEVRHCGKNSLPLCTHFEKRFCRPPGADAQQPRMLFGFNHQPLARTRKLTHASNHQINLINATHRTRFNHSCNSHSTTQSNTTYTTYHIQSTQNLLIQLEVSFSRNLYIVMFFRIGARVRAKLSSELPVYPPGHESP